MGAFLIYKKHIDKKSGRIRAIELREIDKNEEEASRYVKLYNLQRTLDEKNTASYHYLYIDVL